MSYLRESRAAAVLSLAALILLLGAAAPPGGQPFEGSAPVASSAVNETLSLTIRMTRAVTFDPTELVAAPGQNISLAIINEASMVHSFTLYSDVNLTDVPLDVIQPMIDFNATHDKWVDVWVPGGETWTVNFTAPTAIGRYVYVCMVTGHWITMNGVLIVGLSPSPPVGFILGLVPSIMVGTIAFVLVFAGAYHLRAVREARRMR